MNYMLTGSWALNFYTIPRMTRDIDLVIDVFQGQEMNFLALFRERFHMNEYTVTEEFMGKGVGIFNLIDNQTFYKIDFIIHKKNRYEQVKFSNRRQVIMDCTEVWIISPEDLIVSKLQWIQQLESDRQKDDIRQLLTMPDLNYRYMADWADYLKLNTYNLLP